jgi:crossover junction endodeoxyribonuclease RusA
MLEALGGRKPDWTGVSIHWEFHPKTATRPDDDNCIASCKAYRDGIADALGIDDAKFTTTHTMGQPVKGGAVNVTVRQANG